MTIAITLGTSELAVGLVLGLTYALLGMGLVLIYRTTRVIHFGYGEIGAFGALVLAKLVLDRGWSWWLAFPVAVGLAALVSAVWERTVIRRLFHAPRLVLLVATIGIGQVMFAVQLLMGTTSSNDVFPTPIHLHQPIGSFILRGDHLVILVAVPAIALGLTWFLNRTIWGLAIRGSATNEDAASLAGVHVRRMSTVAWAIGGLLAATTFILILPVRGAVLGSSAQAVGAGLLLRALVVGMVGRMESMAYAAAGGVALGIIESVLVANVDSSGAIDLVVFALALVLLTIRPVATGRERAIGGNSWFRELRFPDSYRRWRLPVFAAVGSAALLAPFLTDSPGRQFQLASVPVFAIIAVSVVVITGWAGQVSLCQFSFVGLGALLTAALTRHGMSFGFAVIYAMAATAMAATAVGLPALRIRGLFLAAGTLAFGVAANGWLFSQGVFRNDAGQIRVDRPRLGPFDLANQRTYYYLCLGVLTAVVVLVSGLRRSGIGRAIVAVRDNEAAASALTIASARAKLLAFALSGAIAGLAGGLYGGLYVNLSPGEFGPQLSFQVLAMAIIGGVTSVAGAVLGAVYVIGLPQVFSDSLMVSLMTSGVGLLILLLFTRGGLIEVVQRLAIRLHRGDTDRWTQALTDDELRTRSLPSLVDHIPSAAYDTESASADAVISCRGVEVRYGGIVANSGVDLSVAPGELVGLIGTNGAGKSTLIDAIGGFAPVTAGTITIEGQDVTTWPPHERARLGLGRVFQDGALFPTLTVRESLLVALEPREPSEFVPSLLRLPPAVRGERHKRALADDLLDLTGLGPYRSARIAELSTGTRRIVEIASLLASGARILLLDEPTAGIAQREVEALGGVIHDMTRQLHASMLLVEHDMPLVMSLSDRIVCMAAGTVIAEGTPDEIRRDPRVVASYLGTDERAIDRSDASGSSRSSGPARSSHAH